MSKRPAAKQVRLAILDFDNTLWDHHVAFEHGMRQLVADLQAETGCTRQAALDGITQVNTAHQAHMTPAIHREHPALLAKHSGKVPEAVAHRLAQRYARAQEQASQRYDGVLASIAALKAQGVRVVMFTEGRANRLLARMAATGFDTAVFDDIWCKPADDGPAALAHLPSGSIKPMTLRHGKLVIRDMKLIKHSSPKSDPRFLKAILAHEGVSADQAVMVGDSLLRDVKLAQDAGIMGIHARYGQRNLPASHPYLRSMPSNWMAKADKMDRQAARVKPDAVLKDFRGLLNVICGPKPPHPRPRQDRRRKIGTFRP